MFHIISHSKATIEDSGKLVHQSSLARAFSVRPNIINFSVRPNTIQNMFMYFLWPCSMFACQLFYAKSDQCTFLYITFVYIFEMCCNNTSNTHGIYSDKSHSHLHEAQHYLETKGDLIHRVA